MKAVTTFAVVLSFLLPAWAYAATCPDRAPAAITSVGSAALKCQKTISKSGVKFIGKKAKGLAKCRQKEATGTCPDAKTQSRIDGAIAKLEDKVAKTCTSTCSISGAECIADSLCPPNDDTNELCTAGAEDRPFDMGNLGFPGARCELAIGKPLTTRGDLADCV